MFQKEHYIKRKSLSQNWLLKISGFYCRFCKDPHFLMCFSRVVCWLNGIAQKWHLRTSLPTPCPWVFMCRVSLLLWAQEYGQSSHLYGFSPVWLLRWTVRLLQFLNTFPQNSQELFPLAISSRRYSGLKSALICPFSTMDLMALGSIGGSFEFKRSVSEITSWGLGLPTTWLAGDQSGEVCAKFSFSCSLKALRNASLYSCKVGFWGSIGEAGARRSSAWSISSGSLELFSSDIGDWGGFRERSWARSSIPSVDLGGSLILKSSEGSLYWKGW